MTLLDSYGREIEESSSRPKVPLLMFTWRCVSLSAILRSANSMTIRSELSCSIMKRIRSLSAQERQGGRLTRA
jgi:hypothetical protein